jgi:drug/metabolite transporter (DMT)-like permease
VTGGAPRAAGGAIRPWVGIALLAGIAVVFAANHVAARLAFDHGTSVATAVAVRSGATALVVIALVRASGVAMALPPATRSRALLIGVALAVQSWCLYSSVARIPVALALLTFNTFPILLALLSWASGGERPSRRTAIAMPVILLGLALALDLPGALASGGRSLEDAPRFAAGVAFAFGASMSFAIALVLTTRWLGKVDGRVRTVWTMGTVAVVVGAAGWLGDGFALPRDAAGWTGLALLTVLYGAAFTSLFVLLPRLGAVNNSPVMNIEPIASMVLAWVILGQRITPVQVLGAAVVVGAIVWMSARRR